MDDFADKGSAVSAVLLDVALKKTKNKAAEYYIKNDVYLCSMCGESISVARKKALPGTTICVDCAEELDEIEERRRMYEGV